MLLVLLNPLTFELLNLYSHQKCIEINTQVNNLESLGGLPVGKSEKKIKRPSEAPESPVPPVK